MKRNYSRPMAFLSREYQCDLRIVPKVTISHKNIPTDPLMKEWENTLVPYLIPHGVQRPCHADESQKGRNSCPGDVSADNWRSYSSCFTGG